MKDIALRVEGIFQAETEMSLTASAVTIIVVAGVWHVPGSSTLVIPQTMTLNFQSGIAEDTLLFGSIIEQNGMMLK